MRAMLILALSCLLAGCVTAEETEKISDAWGRCIMNAVARVDDGKTDPVSIAYGAAPQCAGLYNQLTEAEVGRLLTDNSRLYMRAQMADGEVQMVTAAVLAHRKQARK